MADPNAVIDAACARIPPFWPLDAMVATNPYLGYVEQPFEQAAEYQLRILGRRMTAPRAWYRRQFEAGRITEADLQCALEQGRSGLTPVELVAALREPEPPACAPLLYSGLLDERYRPAQSRYVIQQVSQFCAAWYDQGQALWRMPRFADTLYAAWRAYLRIDRSPRWMEISDIETPLAALPEEARAAIPVALEQLGVPADRHEDFLTLTLASIGGWASYLRARRWEAELAGGADDDIVGLLAIRLTWELILLANDDRPERVELWRQSLCCWPERLGEAQARALEIDLLWQRALEIEYQRRLVAGLRRAPVAAAAPEPSRPLALAAFCIDVRSEVFRRALETADPAIRTQGFAGFFGVMARFRPLGAQRARSHLPVLLPASYEVCETAGDGDGPATAALRLQRRLKLGLAKAWKQFKLSAGSCFSFVETAGLLVYVPRLIGDSLGLSAPVAHPETAGLSPAQAARLGPDPDAHCDGAGGIPVEARPETAAFILRAMGLKAPFPRLVLLAGHGSSTVNNPQRAGLDCGACAGQTGAASVRMAAGLLNDARVRAALAAQGTRIPGDTWFLPRPA
ncbi:putative inorganic carbon transporter subunit DabA [Thiohalobacter thiocyanaticus]|uniref:putative inorganic carbon transporter subunit DabA n=1 Tax=Thiohalobacter thiocyanaticus TaxID=585455 RepID=UPI0019D464E6|nr:putative inorganic carbon transporter subunit DabA [Thiohalobacter thiocyanaticus]